MMSSEDLVSNARWLKHSLNGFRNRLVWKQKGLNFIKVNQLVSLLAPQVESYNVCHIIGTGFSVWDSIKKVRSCDFCFGFQYSALIERLKFNLVFFELGGSKVFQEAEQGLAIADGLPQSTIKVFKNAFSHHNDFEFIKKHWSCRALLLADQACMNYDRNYTDFLIKRSLDRATEVFIQVQNTTYIGIILAFQLGFRNIVLHGVDLGGAYFYSKLPEHLQEYTPILSKNFDGNIKPVNLMNDYVYVLRRLRAELHIRNVNLLSASPESGSSAILNCYL